MTRPVSPSLDDLVPELALVREAGLEPLDAELVVASLQALSALSVVRRRAHTDTSLAAATAICQVVREAAERLSDDPQQPGPPGQPSFVAQAQMLVRVHYATKGLSAAEARTMTQAASGVGDRQYRARHESRLLRLVAQAVLDLDREDDLHQRGRALEVGADVPQSVALYWLYLFRDMSAVSQARSQALGSRAVRRTPRLAWDVLVEIYGSEEALRSAVDAARDLDRADQQFVDAVELADRYFGGWRPPQFGGDE